MQSLPFVVIETQGTVRLTVRACVVSVDAVLTHPGRSPPYGPARLFQSHTKPALLLSAPPS